MRVRFDIVEEFASTVVGLGAWSSIELATCRPGDVMDEYNEMVGEQDVTETSHVEAEL